jgi:hypothetical protein
MFHLFVYSADNLRSCVPVFQFPAANKTSAQYKSTSRGSRLPQKLLKAGGREIIHVGESGTGLPPVGI